MNVEEQIKNVIDQTPGFYLGFVDYLGQVYVDWYGSKDQARVDFGSTIATEAYISQKPSALEPWAKRVRAFLARRLPDGEVFTLFVYSFNNGAATLRQGRDFRNV